MLLGVDLMNISDIKNSLIIEIEKLIEIIKKNILILLIYRLIMI